MRRSFMSSTQVKKSVFSRKNVFYPKFLLLESFNDLPVLPIFAMLPFALCVSFSIELGALSGSSNRRCHLPVDFGFPRLARHRSHRLIGLSQVQSSHFIQQTNSNKKITSQSLWEMWKSRRFSGFSKCLCKSALFSGFAQTRHFP